MLHYYITMHGAKKKNIKFSRYPVLTTSKCFTRSAVISLHFLCTKTTRPEYFCCSIACRSCDQSLDAAAAAAARNTISFSRILYEGAERDQGVGGCGGEQAKWNSADTAVYKQRESRRVLQNWIYFRHKELQKKKKKKDLGGELSWEK